MLNVLLTIDTEVYPRSSDWRQQGLRSDIARDIYGVVEGAEVGIEYQLQMLDEHGLKAVFMISPMFALVPEVGMSPLREIVSRITSRGHEIQLHIHPEWVQYIELGVPFRGSMITDYTLDEQRTLISTGRDLLIESGAPAPNAFRGGDYSATLDTIRALKACGIEYDTSYNIDYSSAHCRLPWNGSVGSAYDIEGVLELPIAAFRDFSRHLRPAQLCACSSREMAYALRRAEQLGWDFFVIVSHSFELVGRRWHRTKQPIVRRTVVERFERLCAWLADRPHQFQTTGFHSFSPSRNAPKMPPLDGRLLHTFERTIQQANDRLALTMGIGPDAEQLKRKPVSSVTVSRTRAQADL